MAEHIFLTGEIQVGKTTIIERILSGIDFVPGGFCTVAGGASSDHSIDHIFIIPFGESLDESAGIPPVADRYRNERVIVNYPEIFDTVGVRILKDSDGARLIVMDELGFMESEAEAFQSEVMRLLDGETPIIGVVKRRDTPFLDRVRAHENVTVIEIRRDNRDEIFEKLKDWCDV
ncbi:MAG: nucleoside-triphosphatase [Clostridiales Family XIII bacterium]|jgi:nucleoside-triphosphatase|nr:nucleoside-triphosphatase [Clostridiales Family XIII bacterium]